MAADPRKFLVIGDGWQSRVIEKAFLRYGLLAKNEQVEVQLRIKAEGGVRLTIDTSGQGIEAAVFVCDITMKTADELLTKCADNTFEKIRHLVIESGCRWEVDVYEGRLAGLVIAELAEPAPSGLPNPLPHWIGREIRDESGYSSAALAKHGLP